jgi:hypothetical protein
MAPRCSPANGGERNEAWTCICIGGRRGAATSAARPAAGSGISTIEIIIGAMTVRVPPGADVASLQTVLQALKAVS